MLYDKRWDKPEVKADPFSLESLIAWLEKQPAKKEYDYGDCNGDCLIDLYLGRVTTGTEYNDICNRTGWGVIAARYPRTFGAALERARAAMAQ